jgi:uncharacterized Ntn-hydrolase superfamily protein
MTWSIIAREPETGRIGIIVATRFFAVGALVPHIRTGIGAVATQAFINPHYGPAALTLLADSIAPEEAIARVIAADEGRDHRQVHLMDRTGRTAAHTGQACVDWAGHMHARNLSIAGNMLAGPDVINETLGAYQACIGLPLARRLIAAMHAGEAAGGDKRGRQSAALLIHDDEDYPLYDLRVDDHADPLGELERLHSVANERYVHFRRRMPSRAKPAGTTDRTDLDAFIAASIGQGYE